MTDCPILHSYSQPPCSTWNFVSASNGPYLSNSNNSFLYSSRCDDFLNFNNPVVTSNSHYPQSVNISSSPSHLMAQDISSLCLISLPDPPPNLASPPGGRSSLFSSDGSSGSFSSSSCKSNSPFIHSVLPETLPGHPSDPLLCIPPNISSLPQSEHSFKSSTCPSVTLCSCPLSQDPAVLITMPPSETSPASPTYLSHVGLPSESELHIMLPEGCKMCNSSMDKKAQMENDGKFCDQFLDSLSRFEDWLHLAQITSSLPPRTLHKEAKATLSRYEMFLREMRERLLDLESLNRQYWRLTQLPHRTVLPRVLRSRMQELNQLWDHLQREIEAIHETLKKRVQQREEFDMNQEEMRLWLTEMDQGLSSVEYINSGNPSEKIRQLQMFKEDVRSNMERMEDLFERGDNLINESDPKDAEILEEEIAELGNYCQEIFSHLSRLQKRLVSTKLVFEDDFLDGELEIMSTGSSDVFLEAGSEDGVCLRQSVPPSGSVPYLEGAARGALEVDLEWDPLGDVGRASSNDEQESFYTTASVDPFPRTFMKTSGSQSSFNSNPLAIHGSADDLVDTELQGDYQDLYMPSVSPPKLENKTEDKECQTSAPTIDHRSTQVLYNYLHGSKMQPELNGPFLSCLLGKDEFGFKQRMDQLNSSGDDMKGILCNEPPDSLVSNSNLKHNHSEHRRRHGKKKRLKPTRVEPAVQEVSILMEDGNTLFPCGPRRECCPFLDCSRSWFNRLVSLTLLFLVLAASLFILPINRSGCLSQRFAWSLMLTYVNGPPPT
ncbi:uncharacterized protein LOC134572338 [Pelobates fuscus]|uniref:uncharacterized protein LOC134572338 n=1 Tax=Pelobates fuscus TaxID=191477 RepID=UPI002FE45C0E